MTELGATIAIDDFGTGYSALNYLIQFPIHTLKIDRCFVAQLCQNPQTNAVVCAITMLARSLRHKLVAEGVETQAQAEALQLLGCDEFQGYYFGKPMPGEQILARLAHDAENQCADGVRPSLSTKRLGTG